MEAVMADPRDIPVKSSGVKPILDPATAQQNDPDHIVHPLPPAPEQVHRKPKPVPKP
jgi:hypothetical protein